MNDPRGVRGLEGAQRLEREMDGAGGRNERPLARNELPEVAALQVLHDEIRRAARQAPHVVDLHDVVAVDLRRGDAFVDESLDGALQRQHGAAHEFERDGRAP